MNKDGYRMMPARFTSECAWCALELPKGKQIWWNPVTKMAVCSPLHGTMASRPRPLRQVRSRTMASGGTTD